MPVLGGLGAVLGVLGRPWGGLVNVLYSFSSCLALFGDFGEIARINSFIDFHFVFKPWGTCRSDWGDPQPGTH